MGKYFGTDGIRGRANQVLTSELALKLGKAVAQILAQGNTGKPVLIGKDTRVSGDMLESALAAGIMAAGLDVLSLGVIPTPGVAALCHAYGAPGVVISASHNPYYDNGIKFFSAEGFKLTDAQEAQIEAFIDAPEQLSLAEERMGRLERLPQAVEDYRLFLLQKQNPDLTGLHIGLDCANGAAAPIAAALLRELGAEVEVLAETPDGYNINVECGSTHPEPLQALVRQKGLDLGLALDGDADRLIAVDEAGNLLDGDLLLAIIARQMQAEGVLRNNQLVMTIVSNLGLRLDLQKLGIEVAESPVGDRYVLEQMKQCDAVLGGEQSGHLLLLDYNTTGDALAAALYLLSVMRKSGQSLGQLAAGWASFPQVQYNVTVRDKAGWQENAAIRAAIAAAEQELAASGRVLVRASGTEPTLRVLTEGPDPAVLERLAQQIVAVIEAQIGQHKP